MNSANTFKSLTFNSWGLAALLSAMLAAAACSNADGGNGQSAANALPGTGGTVNSGFGKTDAQTSTAADAAATSTKDTATAGTDQPGADTAQPTADVATGGGEDAVAGTDQDVAAPDPDADPGTDQDTATTDPDVDPAGQDAAPACAVDGDQDGDGYGVGCPLGDDCDDTNPNFYLNNCPDCKKAGTTGCACVAGSKPVACYSGEASWVGKGQCAAGKHTCGSNSFWSDCQGEVFPDPEKCDNKDNDCDGETDEGVKSSCGTCDLTCNEQKIGAASGKDWNLNSENSTGLGTSNGNLVLDATQISLNLKFIWIANSPQSTVSKIDCKTAVEVGRFQVCSDPSRTSVDLEGNVWVGCRGDGKVAKIMAETKNCIDKNGNGIIETAKDGNKVCGTAGCDECVKFIVQPDGGATIARAAGVDKDNHVWMGFWNSSNLRRIEPTAGNVVDTVNIACNPYGLVIDQKGIIWAQGAGCGKLVRVDPATKQIDKYPHDSGYGAYGINVDKFGNIWVASGAHANRFDPTQLKWTAHVNLLGKGGGRGLASSNDGFIYPAVDSSQGTVKINGNLNPPVAEMYMSSGGSPVGAALDYDGFVWIVNQGGASAAKIDPKNGNLLSKTPIGDPGNSPYTYSDMTGYTLNYFTAPKGQFTTVFFGGVPVNPITNNKPKQVWQSVSADAELPDGTSLRMRFRAADDKTTLETANWSDPQEFTMITQFPYNVAAKNIIGNLLQVEVQLITKVKGVSPVLKSLSAKSKLL